MTKHLIKDMEQAMRAAVDKINDINEKIDRLMRERTIACDVIDVMKAEIKYLQERGE
jgi:peptidoglycan hydrolase CwlO-like protein